MTVVSDNHYLKIKAEIYASLQDHDWLTFCYSWSTAEGGHATHNAFNTTLKLPGSTDYNPIPVQNYVSAAQGIAATVSVLKQQMYLPILTGMRNNADPYYLAAKIGQSKWGTDLSLFVRVLADNYGYGSTRP